MVGSNAVFYSGSDDIVVPTMACGFKGVISVLSNIAPKETVRMAHAALEGRFSEAAELQIRMLPLINALFCETSPIPVKAAAARMGICDEELRLPLVPMQPANRKKLFDIMDELGIGK